MKMILAILRPDRLEEVKTALINVGVTGMMVIEGRGMGGQQGHPGRYRGFEYNIEPIKVHIEIAVADNEANQVVETIQKAAFTGEVGDDRIFVYALDKCVRVRTGEIGEASV